MRADATLTNDAFHPAGGCTRTDRNGPSSAPDVSVAIVHYQTPELLGSLPARVAGQRRVPIGSRSFVIDNASSRSDARRMLSRAFPTSASSKTRRTCGFAVASNQALRLATGRYMLLLNPDAGWSRRRFAVMREYMDANPDVGCATCRVELPDGSLDLACRRLFPTPERSFVPDDVAVEALPTQSAASANTT